MGLILSGHTAVPQEVRVQFRGCGRWGPSEQAFAKGCIHSPLLQKRFRTSCGADTVLRWLIVPDPPRGLGYPKRRGTRPRRRAQRGAPGVAPTRGRTRGGARPIASPWPRVLRRQAGLEPVRTEPLLGGPPSPARWRALGRSRKPPRRAKRSPNQSWNPGAAAGDVTRPGGRNAQTPSWGDSGRVWLWARPPAAA